jgi:hypothetical protein
MPPNTSFRSIMLNGISGDMSIFREGPFLMYGLRSAVKLLPFAVPAAVGVSFKKVI